MKKIISCVLMFIMILGSKVKIVETAPPESIMIWVVIEVCNSEEDKNVFPIDKIATNGARQVKIKNPCEKTLLNLKTILGITSDCVIFGKGQILNQNFTFDYYEIKDNDVIIFMVTEKNFNNENRKKFLEYKEVRRVGQRSSDLYLMRAETKPYNYRRILGRFLRTGDDFLHKQFGALINRPQNNIPTNLDYTIEISESALPIFW